MRSEEVAFLFLGTLLFQLQSVVASDEITEKKSEWLTCHIATDCVVIDTSGCLGVLGVNAKNVAETNTSARIENMRMNCSTNA